MRALTVLILLAVAVVPAGAAVRFYVVDLLGQPRREELRRREREWISAAQQRLEACGSVGTQAQAWRRDKVLVWEGNSGSGNSLADLVDAKMRPGPEDERLTVFWITERKDIAVGTYTTGATGYRTDVTVCIIALPEKTAVGMFLVRGGDPATSIRRKQFDTHAEYGDWRGALASWIRSLPVRKPGSGE
jgi:hypothetical protein